MTDPAMAGGQPAPGWRVVDADGLQIGSVDAVFADYLLVRTRGLLPVDLYVPVTAFFSHPEPQTVSVEAASGEEAYRLWHRPLKSAPHD